MTTEIDDLSPEQLQKVLSSVQSSPGRRATVSVERDGDAGTMMIDGAFLEFETDGRVRSVSPSVTDAGYVKMYRTDTGEECLTNRNMLLTQLRKKHPEDHPMAGQRVFSLERVEVSKVKREEHTCMLHPESPQRAAFDDLSLPYCRKSNLVSAFEAQQHMQNKHPREWAVIESMRRDAERQEDRQFQKSILDLATSGKAVGNAPDSGLNPGEVATAENREKGKGSGNRDTRNR